ncbi:hypothetical protein VNI00_005436 [Paramarasmius palmivorus]|uniref:Uncharacterized protein n=1 Tax=Paramarasmius palmivorus TaxID=297713 RepID=A0AAW0DFB7_9AGAR
MQACNTAIQYVFAGYIFSKPDHAIGSILARKSHRNSLHLLKYKVLRDESKDIGRLVHRSMDLPLSEALFFLKDAPEVYFVYTQYREAWKSYWENYDRTTEDLFALIERSSKPGVKDFAEQAKQYDRYTNDGNPPSVAAMLDKVEEMHGGFKARFGKSSYSTSREYTDWVKAVESQYPRWEDFSSVGIRSPPR